MSNSFFAFSIFVASMMVSAILHAVESKPATSTTKAANAAVLRELDFKNKQAFKDAAHRGCLEVEGDQTLLSHLVQK